MGCRPQRQLRFPAHCQWVRGHTCSVPGCKNRDIEAAHFDGPIPDEDRGGMSERDHDKWAFPLCNWHHENPLNMQSYHTLGWKRFDALYGIDSYAIALRMQRASPHRWRWEEREAS